MLTVPLPELAYEALAPSVAAIELPLTVTVAPVTVDEVPQTPVELRTFSLVSYRLASAAAFTEVWDPVVKQWLAEGAAVGPTSLAYLPDEPSPWQGTVVAGGGEDAFGQPQFEKAVGGYPSYSFRAMFATREELTVSGPSNAVTFGAGSDRNLMVLGPGDGEKPGNATEARLQLKDTSLQVIGGLAIRRDSPGAEVTLSNAAGASVVLRPDGSIELRPAAGRDVVVSGDLETERVTYLPAGGGAKKTLV